MAIVMLPCDLPWWPVVQRKLNFLNDCTELDDALEVMQKIHDLCNVSLDPDEDKNDKNLFVNLKQYLLNDISESEQKHFLNYTIKNIIKNALNIKKLRPVNGLYFSLQQESNFLELNYKFIAALLANAFFSTFPKRTQKTHPTLQDFNFTNFFNDLTTNYQKSKLKSVLHYFDWIELNENRNLEGCLKVTRNVMSGKEWLTIDDWLECNLPLCSLDIKHEGRLERSNADIVQTVFVSSRIGGKVLCNGNSQECMQFITMPELLVTLLYVEALEDNETLTIENIRQLSRVIDPKNKAIFEVLDEPKTIMICCLDAESYLEYPVTQFEEDNVLRELNKCLLGFRQNTNINIFTDKIYEKKKLDYHCSRLSPIGESGTNSPVAAATTKIFIKQPTNSTRNSSIDTQKTDEDVTVKRNWLRTDNLMDHNNKITKPLEVGPNCKTNKRDRFIILGSSGEYLPIKRLSYCSKSYNSSDDEYLSAKSSLDSDDEYDNNNDNVLSVNKINDSNNIESDKNNYNNNLDTPERRLTFAYQLSNILNNNHNNHNNNNNNYSVDISINGSEINDTDNYKLKRNNSSCGFILTDNENDNKLNDFNDISFDNNNHQHHQNKKNNNNDKKHLNNNNNNNNDKDNSATNNNNNINNNNINNNYKSNFSNNSSNYSFSTEYSSELEEVFDQFSKWIDDPIIGNNNRILEPRDEAVLRFANSLLKRTLSESYVGIPLTDGYSITSGIAAEESSIQNYHKNKFNNKLINNYRSLSLELAKHKHRLAAQLKNSLLAEFTTTATKFSASPKNVQRKKWFINNFQCEQLINCDVVSLKLAQLGQKYLNNSKLRPIATGNWGCGNKKRGEPQLKLIIQWLAASVSGIPILIYYTAGSEKLTKLDTVCRVLRDRNWTVGELTSATLLHAKELLDDHHSKHKMLSASDCFFEKLIGLDRS